MSRHIQIKDSLYEKLKQEKGDRSFSWAIEQHMNITPVAQTVKNELQAIHNQPVKPGEDNER